MVFEVTKEEEEVYNEFKGRFEEDEGGFTKLEWFYLGYLSNTGNNEQSLSGKM